MSFQGRRVHRVAVFLAIVVFSVGVWPAWWFFIFVILAIAESFGIANRDLDLQIQLAMFLAVVAMAVIAWMAYCFFKWQRTQRPGCLNCDYDLTGNVSGVCPECGTPVYRPESPDSEEGPGES